MVIRKCEFAQDEYYHIYTRAVEKREIFLDDNDYFRFQLLLYICNSEKSAPLSKIIRAIATKKGKPRPDRKRNLGQDHVGQDPVLTQITREDLRDVFQSPRDTLLVDVVSYSIMPNHFHLVLKEHVDGGIQRFMHKLMLAYAMHFNKKYKRVGSLFVRPFRAKHIDSDPYFMHIFSYVHLNALDLIESGWEENDIEDVDCARAFMQEYKWSSYYDLSVAKRPETAILSLQEIPEYIKKDDNIEDVLHNFNDTFWVKTGS